MAKRKQKIEVTAEPEPPPPAGHIALLSDIHGNLDALEAVLEDMKAYDVRSVICLGDVVGYGPEPGACVRLMRGLSSHATLGNHELMLLMMVWRTLGDIGKELTPSIRLARAQLDRDDIAWISAMALGKDLETFSIVHSSFFQPASYPYIQTMEDAENCIREQPTPLSFHGHTHVPVIWVHEHDGMSGFEPNEEPYLLHPRARYSINVGSVGQPRDDDPRACYCLYHPTEHTILHRRVAYDIPAAQARFRAAGMRFFDVERIAEGY